MIKMNLIKLFYGLMLLIYLHGLNAINQVWSEPKNITNDSYHDGSPAICMDNNGVLHCVWIKQFNLDYRCIYYSKSLNQGTTWYPPIKISSNTIGVAYQPSINCDSLNKLLVIYKFDMMEPFGENYYFTEYNGQEWTTPITICDEYLGAFEDEIVKDHQDRLYIFWHGLEHHPFYKYYENGMWSEIINIYTNYSPSLYLEAAVSDIGNNLHCIGYFNQQAVYLYYDFTNNEWFQPFAIGINSYYDPFEDIALDSYGNSFLVWRELNYTMPGDNATVFRKKIGEAWGELELVKVSNDNLVMQNIDVAFDNIFIIDTEDIGDSYDMMLYRKNDAGLWYDDLIFNYYRIEPWKVFHDNDYLYILMLQQLAYGELLDVFITKAPLDSLTTVIKEEKSSNEVSFSISQNYPNPFTHETNIYYELNFSGNVALIIRDITGQEILNRDLGYKNQGKYSVNWDGCDYQRKPLSTGMYYYTIMVNGHYFTRSLILAK
jgi:hypothetical protein